MTMDVQDYEYYEARAKDVKLEDITSDEWNADILASLRDNDPEMQYFSIVTWLADDYDFVIREGNDLGWLGYFVGRSKRLEALSIDASPETDNINIDAFLRGLGHNRSIKDLYIRTDLGESFQSLIPFLRNNDTLRDLNFHFFDIGLQCARNIALLLGQHSSLKRLEFDDTDLDDEGLTEIATALRSQTQIEELSLCSNNISRGGYTALGNTLESCLSLRKLDLFFDHVDDVDVDDEGLPALAAGLKNCHNLTSLSLHGNGMITEVGSRSLSSLFQSDSCRLEQLSLGRMHMGNDGARALAAGLASLPSLKRLNLRGTSIGKQGLQALVEGLISCNLEQLCFSGSTLGESVSGLIFLGALVQRTTNMHSLSLSNSSVTGEGIQCFVQGMAQRCRLTELNLSHNRSITATGLTYLSSLFRSELCSLSKLVLYGINIGDDGAVALANGLIGNKSMTSVKFNVSGITARGWAAFSRLLCDTSSVNNTYLSNHKLVMIGVYEYRTEETPPDIAQYLMWNKSLKQAAAMSKILESHPDIDFAPLFQWKLKCLPLVVAWLEKAKRYRSTESFQCRQLSSVYKFTRGMPQLVVDGYRKQKSKDIQSTSKKRKFDLTL